MAASMSRRDPRPRRARTLWSFSVGPLGLGEAGLGGAGLDRCVRVVRGPRSGRRGEVECLGNFFERRQLVQRAQAEVVQKSLGGGVERRMARHFPVADDVYPVALLEQI